MDQSIIVAADDLQKRINADVDVVESVWDTMPEAIASPFWILTISRASVEVAEEYRIDPEELTNVRMRMQLLGAENNNA